MNNNILIGLNGEKGSGKSTVGNTLSRHFKFSQISFAYPLKHCISIGFGVDIEDFESLEFKETEQPFGITIDEFSLRDFLDTLSSLYKPLDDKLIETIVSKWNGHKVSTYRQLLQCLGTEVCRDMIDDHIWIDILVDKINTNHKAYIVTDARFPDERTAIKDNNGTLVLVKRPSIVSKDSHRSESLMGSDNEYDTVIYNTSNIGTLQENAQLWYKYRYER